MNESIREMEMRATRISMKVGVLQIEDEVTGEESDELKQFKRMSLNQKRDYISKMDGMKSGFVTPGM